MFLHCMVHHYILYRLQGMYLNRTKMSFNFIAIYKIEIRTGRLRIWFRRKNQLVVHMYTYRIDTFKYFQSICVTLLCSQLFHLHTFHCITPPRQHFTSILKHRPERNFTPAGTLPATNLLITRTNIFTHLFVCSCACPLHLRNF